MSPATAIICLVLVLIVLFSVRSYLKKMKNGCCGGGDAPEKVKPADTNPAHYPYHKKVSITGMTCQHCVQRVENAFNGQEGMLARVNLSKQYAEVYAKAPVDDGRIRQIVSKAGYGVGRIEG